MIRIFFCHRCFFLASCDVYAKKKYIQSLLYIIFILLVFLGVSFGLPVFLCLFHVYHLFS